MKQIIITLIIAIALVVVIQCLTGDVISAPYNQQTQQQISAARSAFLLQQEQDKKVADSLERIAKALEYIARNTPPLRK